MRFKVHFSVPALLIIISALLVVAGLVDDRLVSDPTTSALTSIVLNAVIFLIPGILYVRISNSGLTKRMRLRLYSGRHILLTTSASLFLVCAGILLSALLFRLFPEVYISTSVSSTPLYQSDGSFLSILRSVLAFAVFPAVCEEFIFRGIVVGEYETYGVAAACIMSVMMFAMVHFSFVRLPIYLVGGLVMTVVLYSTRSLFASMTVHAVYNSALLLADEYIQRFVSIGSSYILLSFITAVLMLVFGFLFLYEAQKLYQHYAAVGEDSSYRKLRQKGEPSYFVTVLLSPPLWIFIAMYVILSVVS